MNAVVERTERSQVTLKVEVEPERLAKATDKAYQRLVQRVNIPGFRKGKAPRKILERAVGTDALYREALDFVMPAAYEEAVKETGIAPYARPEFEVLELNPEKPLIFKAVVPVQPTVTLGDYRQIKLDPPELSVSDQDVDEALENLRQSHAQLVPADDRPVRMGDEVTLEVTTTLEGRGIGPQRREIIAQLDADSPLPRWANALAGLSVGDNKDIEDHIPADYQDRELAGKIATYSVSVKAIKQRELPDIDDELARGVGDYENLAALRADLQAKLLVQKRRRAQEEFEAALIDKVIESAQIEFPPVMVERELDHMLREADSGFRRQGFTLDLYLRGTKKSVDDLREEWTPRAVRRVQTGLVLKEIVAAEQLELKPEELQAELDRMVEDSPADQRADVRRLVSTDRVRQSVADELLLRKAIDTLDRVAGGEQFIGSEGVQ